MSSDRYEVTIDEKLSDITEMLARIEERQINQSGRVEQLEGEMKNITKQVNVAHGGILVLTILGTIVAVFKSLFGR